MNARLSEQAEEELESAFNYYQLQQTGLGVEFVHEFRHGLEKILEFPEGWRKLDDTFRRYRMRRFP